MANDAELDRALEAAHLPALVAAMVHLTGDASWLKAEWMPVYTPLSRGDTGLPDEVQADIRSRAKVAIEALLAGAPLKAPTPDTPTLRKMMDFVAGAPIPETYADFLIDELAISGKSSKDPQFGLDRHGTSPAEEAEKVALEKTKAASRE